MAYRHIDNNRINLIKTILKQFDVDFNIEVLQSEKKLKITIKTDQVLDYTKHLFGNIKRQFQGIDYGVEYDIQILDKKFDSIIGVLLYLFYPDEEIPIDEKYQKIEITQKSEFITNDCFYKNKEKNTFKMFLEYNNVLLSQTKIEKGKMKIYQASKFDSRYNYNLDDKLRYYYLLPIKFQQQDKEIRRCDPRKIFSYGLNVLSLGIVEYTLKEINQINNQLFITFENAQERFKRIKSKKQEF